MSAIEREEVIQNLSSAIQQLENSMSASLIPEVGSNIVYALKNAKGVDDVAGVEGRIVKLRGTVHPVGNISFGASDHIARIVLTAMKFDPKIRCAANIRFSEKLIDLLGGMMFEICSFDRKKQPPGISTMDWGVASCCKDYIPDVVFDRGDIGKEPMIRIIGENPEVVTRNIIKISTRIDNTIFED